MSLMSWRFVFAVDTAMLQLQGRMGRCLLLPSEGSSSGMELLIVDGERMLSCVVVYHDKPGGRRPRV